MPFPAHLKIILYDCSVPGISTWTIDNPLVEDDACPPFDALPPLFEITDDALDGLECLVLFPGVLFFLSVGSELFKNSNCASSVSFFLTNWSPALDVTGVEEPATSLDLLSNFLVVAPWHDVACLLCALRNGAGLELVGT